MRGTGLLIACVALLVASSGRAQAGVMISISGFTSNTSSAVGLSGSLTAGATDILNITTLRFTSSNRGGSTYTGLQASFGSVVINSIPIAQIKKMDITPTYVELFLTASSQVNLPAGQTLSLTGSGNAGIKANISTLGSTNMSLSQSLFPGQESSIIITPTLGSGPEAIIPEPSSIAIFGLGALCMLAMSVRQRSKQKAIA